MSEGVVHVRGLEIRTRIGVPDEERAVAQMLKVDLEMTGGTSFEDLNDDVSRTIDYHAVCLEVERLAATGERRLIETLAVEIANLVVDRFGALSVKVSIRKFIVPQAEWTGVELARTPDP